MRRATADPLPVRGVFIGLTAVFMTLFLVCPVIVILIEALDRGLAAYGHALLSAPSLSSIRLTLLVAALVVPLNTVFGLCAAWAITHFNFPGKTLLISAIELPLWVSPVIGGLAFALLFGRHGWFGPWLDRHDITILFAYPGIVIATAFVTLPFVARGLIPLMQAQGHAEEEAALTLGAGGWQIFWRVSFPKIKWGVLYGVVLCNARAMGEFGAVSVVAGSIENSTCTMPLQVEQYYLSLGGLSKAFALSSVLLGLTAVTLVVKTVLEWRRPQPQRRRLPVNL
jgi:sulfate transport system permease protein